MKTAWKILIPVLLLTLLLIGGGLLYRQLSQDILPLSGISGENTIVSPYQDEFDKSVALSDNPTADFTVLDEEGNSVSLSEYFGQPIVVNVWATWCPPCRAELPYFDAAAKQYEGQIRFMMIDLTDGETDTVASATAFAREENSYSFPLYFDSDFSAVKAYQINAIPVTLFIRADGSLLHQQIGAMDEATFASYILQLLNDY